ncbi:hypothetical protein ACIQ4I_08685 [Rummeliibacillus sp. NPDC094406]|uniref:hypothetical protein n=1 Tax=Rummeliibacillus sp. NPDC094406 TaxID=3364511 RepID=UPI003819EA11
MKYLKIFSLMIVLLLISVGCSEQNGTEEIESFLTAYYSVSYEESNQIMNKLYEELNKQLEGKGEETIITIDTPKFGEIYPKSFESYFTKKEFDILLRNRIFSFLPQLAIVKKADYELQSLKQLTFAEKEDHLEYTYEVELNEIIDGKKTSYTDEVRFYVVDEDGEWKISNLRFFNQEYAK